MKKCSLTDFSEALKPWLEKKYLRKVVVTGDRVTLNFNDGVADTYTITDCSKSQVDKVLADLARKGIDVVEKA